MCGFDDEMPGLVNHSFFAPSVSTPKDKDQMRNVVVEIANDVFGEYFPAFAAVATSEVRLDG